MAQRIVHVEDGGIAGKLGIAPGDALVAIDGKAPLDLIDYQAFTCKSRLSLTIERGGATVEHAVVKGRYEPLGLGFDQMLMSRQRDCVNRCVFCFVDQLPPGARPSLKVKDDDWRMSLMMGNFVTLTNVSDAELNRIIRRKCAPLYISVHATDGALRAHLLGQGRGAAIMEQLTRIAEAGLTFHTQAVLCPGLNDGEQLEKTMRDLAQLRPAALSLALVPVGLTGHRENLCVIRPFDKEGAARVLDQAERMRRACRADADDPFVHPADELYLLAGRALPDAADYGAYPQIENGVGLLRLLEEQYGQAWREADFSRVQRARVVIGCGTSVAPFMRDMLERMPVPGVEVEVRPVENRFFGPSVTVSGLLTGSDMVRALKGARADRLLISQNMLREGADVFLDDMHLDEVERALGAKLYGVSGGAALLEAIADGQVGGESWRR